MCLYEILMSEEPLVKDGALFFNAPDRKASKPHVVYYDIAAQSTGIEYEITSNNEEKVTTTTTFKVLTSLGCALFVASVISVIYFFVVKLRRNDDTPKVSPDAETQQEEEVDVVLPEIQPTLHPDVVDNDHDFIKHSFEKLQNNSVKLL